MLKKKASRKFSFPVPSACIGLCIFAFTACGNPLGDNSQVNFSELPGEISPTQSLMEIDTSALVEGASATITITGIDGVGEPMVEGGDIIQLSLYGGTSSGTLSEVTNNGDGTYSATFTASTSGSSTQILASFNGITFTGDRPSVTVHPGAYYRQISFSTPTDQNEYQVKVELTSSNFTYANAQSSGQDIRFVDSSFNRFSYWIEKYNVSDASVIWVKVPSGGTSSMTLYYGNPYYSSTSNKEEVFTYDTPKDLYVELSPAAPGGQSTNIYSYWDSNTVTVQESGGASGAMLNQYGGVNFSSLIQGVISANGGIVGRGQNVNAAFDTFVPMVWASTATGFADTRGSDRWDFYNPNSTSATVTVSNFNSGGAFVGTLNTAVPALSFGSISLNVSSLGLIESTVPVLSFYSVSLSTDATTLPPAETELFGVNSNGGAVGFTEDGTSGTIYYSNGSSTPFSGNRGGRVDLASGGSQGNAQGVRVVANKPVFANSQADSDGNESMAFIPRDEIDSEYIVPGSAEYISITCPDQTSISVYNNVGALVQFGICTPVSSNHPGFMYFNSGYAAGTRLIGTLPFFAYYEFANDDETNFTGPKQARLFMETPPVCSVGAENSI